MKLLISLSLAGLSALSQARPIVIRHAHREHAEWIARVLSEQYHIPADFVVLQPSELPCERHKDNSPWQLCIDASGDLYEVHADVSFIRETLRVFL